jgi:hypothetical protein
MTTSPVRRQSTALRRRWRPVFQTAAEPPQPAGVTTSRAAATSRRAQPTDERARSDETIRTPNWASSLSARRRSRSRAIASPLGVMVRTSATASSWFWPRGRRPSAAQHAASTAAIPARTASDAATLVSARTGSSACSPQSCGRPRGGDARPRSAPYPVGRRSLRRQRLSSTAGTRPSHVAVRPLRRGLTTGPQPRGRR